MILIGTMNWASTKLRGMFQCPNCGTTQKFRLRASRPFLTLYFIPVLPIGGLQEFVECGGCKSSFETIVLANHMLPGTTPTSEGEVPDVPAFEEDLAKIIALMMVEDGHVTESEIRVATRLFENMTEIRVSREQLGQLCSDVRLNRLTSLSFLATATQRRTHEEKLLLVQAMFGVAGAEGELTGGRMESLLKAQQLLGLDESEFESAIANTTQWLN